MPALTCNYCTDPREDPEIGVCAYHGAVEDACNLSEVEYNGHTFGWYVDQKVHEWGFGERHDAERERQILEAELAASGIPS